MDIGKIFKTGLSNVVLDSTGHTGYRTLTGGTGKVLREHQFKDEPIKSASPSDQQAQLIREQWDDYMARFKPKETELMGLAMGNADNQLSEQRAIGAANTGFGVANSTLGRMRSRLGQTMTGDETANENRQNSSLKQAAVVTAQNRARFHARDRDNAILTGANLGQGL